MRKPFPQKQQLVGRINLESLCTLAQCPRCHQCWIFVLVHAEYSMQDQRLPKHTFASRGNSNDKSSSGQSKPKSKGTPKRTFSMIFIVFILAALWLSTAMLQRCILFQKGNTLVIIIFSNILFFSRNQLFKTALSEQCILHSYIEMQRNLWEQKILGEKSHWK